MPGLAAILTSRIVGLPLSSLRLGRWIGKLVLVGYLIPNAYCLSPRLARGYLGTAWQAHPPGW